MDHAASYYAATAHPSPARPPLEGDVRADVCVVGAGIAGCSAALELAVRGYRVVLLEAAPGRLGRVGPQRRTGDIRLRHRAEEHRRRRSASRTRAGCGTSRSKRWRCCGDGSQDHAIDCDLHWGHLHVATKPAAATTNSRNCSRNSPRPTGTGRRACSSATDVESLLATQRYCAGLFDPGSGHLHPLNYTLGLARAAEAAGVRICESSAVTSIEPGDPVRVVTPRGTVTADFAVLTRGGYVDGPAHRRRLARDAGGHLRRRDRAARRGAHPRR